MHLVRTTAAIVMAGSLLLSGGASALAPRDSLGHWIDLVAARNAIAHDVAAYKFPAGRPIEDPRREAAVLADKRERALQRGLDPDSVVAAYRQLIEANKLLQHVDVYHFLLGAPPPPAPSLESIRQRIDALDARLVSQWAQLDEVRTAADCPRRLAQAIAQQPVLGQKVEEGSRSALVRATLGFCQPGAATAADDAAGH